LQRFLGIDLGGTNIKYSIIEFNGNRVAEILKDQIATEAKSGPKNVVDRIAGLITKLDSQFALPFLDFLNMTPEIFDFSQTFPEPGKTTHSEEKSLNKLEKKSP
jgi:hexokinase